MNTTKLLELIAYKKENEQYDYLIKVTKLLKCEIQSEQNFLKRTKTLKSFKNFMHNVLEKYQLDNF